MRILIVDDEPLARLRLAALLASCEGADVVGSVSDGETALIAIAQLRPDVLLLDINMPGLDGVALARRLAQSQDLRPQVIFSTAHDRHALDAFELGAADYLLKPVRLERLREALQRVSERLRQRMPLPAQFIHGRLRGEQVRIALDQVICLIADDKYVTVQHSQGELLIEASLRQFEESHADQLVRLHRNCLVSLSRLLGLKVQSDGRVLARLAGSQAMPEVSRRNLATVRKRLRSG